MFLYVFIYSGFFNVCIFTEFSTYLFILLIVLSDTAFTIPWLLFWIFILGIENRIVAKNIFKLVYFQARPEDTDLTKYVARDDNFGS